MFITLEGIEGSGKTTLIENLADVFRTLNHEVLVTRGHWVGMLLPVMRIHSTKNTMYRHA